MLAGVLVLGLGAFAIAEEIEGDDEPNTINGTAQADEITGGRNDDKINGLGGDDTLNGNGDNDRIDGGDGNDKVFGSDCELGELGRLCDNVGRDVLFGGPGDDDLRANKCMKSPDCQTATNISLGTRQRGGPGKDSLLGAEAHDVLWGNEDDDTAKSFLGKDSLIGGKGNDKLDGGAAADRIWGQDGNDRLTGGPGPDRLSGGADQDWFFAVDRKRDRILCGTGRDRVTADKRDRVSRNCERVKRR